MSEALGDNGHKLQEGERKRERERHQEKEITPGKRGAGWTKDAGLERYAVAMTQSQAHVLTVVAAARASKGL